MASVWSFVFDPLRRRLLCVAVVDIDAAAAVVLVVAAAVRPRVGDRGFGLAARTQER